LDYYWADDLGVHWAMHWADCWVLQMAVWWSVGYLAEHWAAMKVGQSELQRAEKSAQQSGHCWACSSAAHWVLQWADYVAGELVGHWVASLVAM